MKWYKHPSLFTHFLYVPFTGLGLYHGYRGDTWLKNRIAIFKQFVLPSILNQTKRNFVVWISWRPEEKTNLIVRRFMDDLLHIRDLDVVFTFGGVCFWDDKYDDTEASRRLMSSLQETLPELYQFVSESEYVYMTIQPSDDMYLSHSVETIQKFFSENEESVFGFKQGYMIDYSTKEIALYNPSTTPPFYTIKFPMETFINPMLHFDYTGAYKSHEYVKDFLPSWYSYERSFVVGIHGENISTTWKHPFRGAILSKGEQEKVLIQTGNLFTEPLTVKKDMYRKMMKKILNVLPSSFQKKIISLLSSKKVEKQIKKYKYFNL